MNSRSLKKNKGILVFFIVSFVGFFALFYNNYRMAIERINNYEFAGRVDTISYDEKGLPYVNINNSQYYFSTLFHFKQNIEQGDSLIKNKNEPTIILIKKKNGL